MLYTLTLRDGSTLDVEAPEGASKKEIAQAASQQQRQKRTDTTRERATSQRAAYEAMFDRPEELGLLGNLRTGFGAGFVDVGESATLGALSVLDEENELAARERVQGFAETLRPPQPPYMQVHPPLLVQVLQPYLVLPPEQEKLVSVREPQMPQKKNEI